MDSKTHKRVKNKMTKNMGVKKDFKPGSLLTNKKRPTKKLVATLGLI